ncbi:unnamed protein product [Blepharisma stoltei]|uniref:FAD-binding domain-containing protein n=1 Tax=Blepharisma stoltei TaxID=1481888 RepID=A0AAU9IV42_9CILI|nr:unnamed protein product [Blepharisma stoltei]
MKIIIIGAGPVGLTCSHLLGLSGIENVILEKQKKLSQHPSAHFLHSRTMEVFRDIGVSNLIYSKMPENKYWRHINYCSEILGETYRRHDHFSTENYRKNSKLSDMDVAHLALHKLTKILYENLPSKSSMIFDRELTELSQSENGVKIRTNQGDTYECDYLIAADGQFSTVRNLLGIKMTGFGSWQDFINIHFFSKELGKLAKRSPAMVFFVLSPYDAASVVMHDPDDGEFNIHLPIFGKGSQFYSEKEIKEIIIRMSGTPLKDIVIKSTWNYKMSSTLANSFSNKRVFLVGDSTHQMPMAGGFGVNSGIKDAHNLCWKFSYEKLLETYGEERQNFDREILKIASENFVKLMKIAEASGLEISGVENYKKAADYLPFGESLFNFASKMGQRFLFDQNKARAHLADERNLLCLINPKGDFEISYKSGFFENGGELSQNIDITDKESAIKIRKLLGLLWKENKKPTFLQLTGRAQLKNFPYEIYNVPSCNDDSYIIRPDGYIYSIS